MPTFERVADGRVVERRHVPYKSRDLPRLEKSPAWAKVSETYAPATDDRPSPTVEEQRAERAAQAKAARTKAPAKQSPGDG